MVKNLAYQMLCRQVLELIKGDVGCRLSQRTIRSWILLAEWRFPAFEQKKV